MKNTEKMDILFNWLEAERAKASRLHQNYTDSQSGWLYWQEYFLSCAELIHQIEACNKNAHEKGFSIDPEDIATNALNHSREAILRYFSDRLANMTEDRPLADAHLCGRLLNPQELGFALWA